MQQEVEDVSTPPLEVMQSPEDEDEAQIEENFSSSESEGYPALFTELEDALEAKKDLTLEDRMAFLRGIVVGQGREGGSSGLFCCNIVVTTLWVNPVYIDVKSEPST
jgi:hypothetical protein